MLVDALYGGQDGRSTSRRWCKFEDGRTGMVAADLRIDDAKTLRAAHAQAA